MYMLMKFEVFISLLYELPEFIEIVHRIRIILHKRMDMPYNEQWRS